jgi:hypothetical protein
MWGKIKAHTEGNGEVNVTNKREVGSVGTLGLDELDEGVGSLGDSVCDGFGRVGGRGRWRVPRVPDARAVEGVDIVQGRGRGGQGGDWKRFVGRGSSGDRKKRGVL